MSGRLEVITGPMFSGKTDELLRRYRRLVVARQDVVAVKPITDDRYGSSVIKSHSGQAVTAKTIGVNGKEFLTVTGSHRYVIVDEAQFFEEPLIEQIDLFISAGGKVIVCGLDQTFRREPFGIMPVLLAKAESVLKLTAVCHRCGSDAYFTQRLIDGKPAPFVSPTVLVGGLETYEARCRRCFREGSGLNG
jgi:thymidine kinase